MMLTYNFSRQMSQRELRQGWIIDEMGGWTHGWRNFCMQSEKQSKVKKKVFAICKIGGEIDLGFLSIIISETSLWPRLSISLSLFSKTAESFTWSLIVFQGFLMMIFNHDESKPIMFLVRHSVWRAIHLGSRLTCNLRPWRVDSTLELPSTHRLPSS